jgi:hypothetical protein
MPCSLKYRLIENKSFSQAKVIINNCTIKGTVKEIRIPETKIVFYLVKARFIEFYKLCQFL